MINRFAMLAGHRTDWNTQFVANSKGKGNRNRSNLEHQYWR